MNSTKFAAIQVPTRVRDQLRELASREGRTSDGMIEKLIAEYQWRQEVEAAKKAMREAPQEVWDEYMREFRELDGTLMDGLEEYPWEPNS